MKLSDTTTTKRRYARADTAGVKIEKGGGGVKTFSSKIVKYFLELLASLCNFFSSIFYPPQQLPFEASENLTFSRNVHLSFNL